MNEYSLKNSVLSNTSALKDPNAQNTSAYSKKGRRPFTPEEDAILAEIVSQGVKGWVSVASKLPGRTARQCRERWMEYLDPNIKYEPWSEIEDMLLLELIQKNGHKWTLISKAFIGRTDNDVKNRWYTHLKDAAYTALDGKLRILRDCNGNIVSTKKKRKRKIVCANQNAFQAVSSKQQQGVVDSSPQKILQPSKLMEVEKPNPPLLPPIPNFGQIQCMNFLELFQNRETSELKKFNN